MTPRTITLMRWWKGRSTIYTDYGTALDLGVILQPNPPFDYMAVLAETP
jgi:hypothetical protein